MKKGDLVEYDGCLGMVTRQDDEPGRGNLWVWVHWPGLGECRHLKEALTLLESTEEEDENA